MPKTQFQNLWNTLHAIRTDAALVSFFLPVAGTVLGNNAVHQGSPLLLMFGAGMGLKNHIFEFRNKSTDEARIA